MSYNMGYFIPVSEEAKQVWEDYRRQYRAHLKAASKLSEDIGATRFCIGFGGSLVAAEFKGEVHPAFSKQERRGAHPVLSRGRTAAQKEAIAYVEERNKELRALKPAPEAMAEAHGFIFRYDYKYEDGNGFSSIGDPFRPVQAIWFDPDGVIALYAPDAKIAIEKAIERNKEMSAVSEWTKPFTEITPSSWSVPEGYKQISKNEWELMKAAYLVEREKAGHKDEEDDD